MLFKILYICVLEFNNEPLRGIGFRYDCFCRYFAPDKLFWFFVILICAMDFRAHKCKKALWKLFCLNEFHTTFFASTGFVAATVFTVHGAYIEKCAICRDFTFWHFYKKSISKTAGHLIFRSYLNTVDMLI